MDNGDKKRTLLFIDKYIMLFKKKKLLNWAKPGTQTSFSHNSQSIIYFGDAFFNEQ